mmetsp:Transcript_130947/g.195097  ORF Transcript_130947/g.195097 Transcript_130947/m.195097 type:complete len:117 (+) Transcript_130947:86-436(+)
MAPAESKKEHDTHWFEPVAATNCSQPAGAARASRLSKVATIITPASTSNAKPHKRTYPDLPECRKAKKPFTSLSRATMACCTTLTAIRQGQGVACTTTPLAPEPAVGGIATLAAPA